MKLYIPTRESEYITQYFGKNSLTMFYCSACRKYYSRKGSNICPSCRKIMPLVKVYENMGLKGHNGIDWRCYYKEPIDYNCSNPGIVKMVDNDPTGGMGVEVVSYDKDTDKYYKHIAWHFIKVNVKVGDKVECGDNLGLGDTTGISTGNHDHEGVKQCNKDGTTLDYNNGYKGAIDPYQFYDMEYHARELYFMRKQIPLLYKAIEALKGLLSILKK